MVFIKLLLALSQKKLEPKTQITHARLIINTFKPISGKIGNSYYVVPSFVESTNLDYHSF